MNALLLQALRSLKQRVAAGEPNPEVIALLVPEARYVILRVCDYQAQQLVDVAVAASAQEAGTAQTFLRGTRSELLAGLAAEGAEVRLQGVVQELLRSAAWTEQMLLPRSQAPPPLPSDEQMRERRSEVKAALLSALSLEPPWQPAFFAPLPQQWPLLRGVGLVSYAAATHATAPTLFEHTALLVRASYDPLCQFPPVVQRSDAAVSPVSTASVQALSGAELTAVQALPPLDRCFAKITLGLPEPELAAHLRAHYRFQRRRAGWFYEALRSSHTDFFAWLESEQ